MAKIYKNLTSTLYLCVRGPITSRGPGHRCRGTSPRHDCLTFKMNIYG